MKQQKKRLPGRPIIIEDRVIITRSVPRSIVATIDQIIRELKAEQKIKR